MLPIRYENHCQACHPLTFDPEHLDLSAPHGVQPEIVDAFGQTSLLQFGRMATNVTVAPETFRFVPPKGADVIEQ